MTLNQSLSRVERICLAHNQVRTFLFGVTSEMFNDKRTLYPAILFQDNIGELSPSQNQFTLSFKLYAVDLVNISQNTKSNEVEVFSDMLEVIKDIVAEMNKSTYTDWAVTASNAVTLVREQFNDLVGGATVDISIKIQWDQNTCAVPTEALPGQVNPDDMKLVYDVTYISDGSEGSTLSIPTIVGKKVLLIIRENSPLHKVSNLPASSEYTWNDTVVGLGTPVNPEAPERFLILYRTY